MSLNLDLPFSSLIHRIGGKSTDVWEIHYEAKTRQQHDDDVIILSVGEESDEYTPSEIQRAGIESIESGRHHYTSVLGDDRLRQNIAVRHQSRTGQQVSADNVSVFSGAQNALFATSLCLLEHGTEVIVPELYYATYPASVKLSGATMIPLPTDMSNGFQIDIDALEKAITPRTQAILLNSPNNPTGAVYSRKLLMQIVELCRKNRIWIISDEVYAEIAPQDFVSVSSLEGADDITVTISSVSKSHRMTGWRCGWTVSPETLNDQFYNLNMCMAYGLPAFVQDATAYALEHNEHTAIVVRDKLMRNRDVVKEVLSHMHGAHLYAEGGGMFAVLDVRPLGRSSSEFAWGLLNEQKVSLLPCDGFGSSGQGLLRIGLCLDEGTLRTAAQRILAYVETVAG